MVSPYFFLKKLTIFSVIILLSWHPCVPSDRFSCKNSAAKNSYFIGCHSPVWCHPGRFVSPRPLVTPLILSTFVVEHKTKSARAENTSELTEWTVYSNTETSLCWYWQQRVYSFFLWNRYKQRCWTHRRWTESVVEGTMASTFPSLFHPSFSPSSSLSSLSVPSFPVLSLRSKPLKSVSSTSKSGRSPAAKRVLVHCKHKFASFWLPNDE